ncbi:hypothetical protein INT47_007880, partial [Mucor saturninus]
MLTTRQEVNGLPHSKNYRNVLLDAFQLYKLPIHISQDYIDPVDGHVHRFQNRCLGSCSLTFGSIVFPLATFYEITESEISEINTRCDGSPDDDAFTPINTTADNTALDGLANYALNTTTKGLPPKKRKRRRMIRYEIIFSVDKGPIHLSPEHTFFALPRDAVTECLTETSKVKTVFICLCFPKNIISYCSRFFLNHVVSLKIHNVL